jgi:hypothetical protein
MCDESIKKLFGESSFSHIASRKRQSVSSRGRLPKQLECPLVHHAKPRPAAEAFWIVVAR